MATPTFEQLKVKLDAACETLRGFTLGHNGYSQKSGRIYIKRVADICDKLSKLPDPGWGAPVSTTLIALGRGRIKAAEARLALLTKKVH